MIIPVLATGAVAATVKEAAEKAACSFEPSTGTYRHFDAIPRAIAAIAAAGTVVAVN